MSEAYLNRVSDFEKMCSTAIDLSVTVQGRVVETWREEYASYFFSKVCLTAISILRLLPKSSYYKTINDYEIWDISSVCTLARALIETYNVFYYLVIDEIDQEELDFRFILWRYHDKCERGTMLDLIGSNSSELAEIKNKRKELQEKLENNIFYQKLVSERYFRLKDIREGKIGVYLSNNQISERAGISIKYFKALYKNLSNHVHTHPYAFSVISSFNANDEESRNLFKTVIESCIAYLGLAIQDFIHFAPDLVLPDTIVEEMEDWIYVIKNFDIEQDE